MPHPPYLPCPTEKRITPSFRRKNRGDRLSPSLKNDLAAAARAVLVVQKQDSIRVLPLLLLLLFLFFNLRRMQAWVSRRQWLGSVVRPDDAGRYGVLLHGE